MIGRSLSKIEQFVLQQKLLLILLFVTFLVRLPSLYEPFWYGDEGVYMAVAQGLERGQALYSGVFDNKPPAIFLLAAASIKFFGLTIWSFRFVLMIWVLVSIIAIYFLGRKMFGNRGGLISASVYAALTATPFLEGNIANAEIFMALPITLGFLVGLNKNYFLSGILFSLAVLFKFPAVFDFGAFFLFTLLLITFKNPLECVKNLGVLTLGFIFPIAATVLYFVINGHFNYFVNATLFGNVNYVDYGNRYIIPNGLLVFKFLPSLLLFSALLIWRFAPQISSFRFFIKRPLEVDFNVLLSLWFMLSLYGASFGGRDFPHYLIQSLPAASFLICSIIIGQHRRMSILLLSIGMALILLFGFRTQYFRANYYPNFVKYATGQMRFDQWAAFFDAKTPRNYALAAYLRESNGENQSRTKVTDRIYIWANEPQIYFLANRLSPTRFVTAYHVVTKDVQMEVVNDLIEKPPLYILVERPKPHSFPELDTLLKRGYNFVGITENVEFYRLSENSSPL
ncbi:MAG: hypothetical protein A2864_00655 [Candidatus Woykebacteria bacterium RIFCSPHIGHO2_01_FULL_39_12]|uniref:Glycosyltransferase RgtA/B/C/D-like domain-containing protein n=1 Tax=Candidatus Woykebacteria bacterium RIFCSPHIGHO2_01_FULL_39_12 TaxID=1802599 RepID=A0A1G1WJV0_9BACT|nr:MAG: hypothetical protein A2864_00655 [Candidatus Woykebacteria bacterium RIFCSPHIGHO2_01_FULL_39_12]